MHSNAGSGHRAHGAQGGHGLGRGHEAASGHLGHTGGTTWDFNIYSSSLPGFGGGGGGEADDDEDDDEDDDDSEGSTVIAVEVGVAFEFLGGGSSSLISGDVGVEFT